MKLWALILLLVGCAKAPAESKPIPPPEPTATAQETPSAAPKAQEPEGDPDVDPLRKIIASYTTKFRDDGTFAKRAHNIELVTSKFGFEVVLAPGEEFSFNQLVGPRTEEAGFQNAPTYFMGETFEGIGGGTCQVSSTLYAAALHAGLTITRRHPHSRPSHYIGPGLDATVSYPIECEAKNDPTICFDLKFKNPYPTPIAIRVNPTLGPDADSGDQRLLSADIIGKGEVPKGKSAWVTWNTPDYEKRTRRVSYWHNERRQLKQKGEPGLEGARYLTLTFPDGHVEKKELVNRYKPVPEVWEVGMDWKNPDP